MVLALLLHDDPASRSRQFQMMDGELRPAWREELARCEEKLRADGAPDRLQVLQDQLPLLQQLRPEYQQQLLSLVQRIIRADGRVSLTEHLYSRMLRDTLEPPSRSRRPGPNELRQACTLLLSLTARAGQHDEDKRLAAYRAGVAKAPLDGLGALLEASAFSASRVDQALDHLAATTEGFRFALYRAARTVAAHDDHINRAEAELLAAIGIALKLDHGADPEPLAEAVKVKKPPPVAALNLAAAGTDVASEANSLALRDRGPAIALVAANLIPLFGVIFFSWDVAFLLLLYWLENLVIGAFTLVRMLSVDGFSALGKAAFFSVHYGFFCAGHGMFVLALSTMGGAEDQGSIDFEEGDIPFLIPFYLLRGIFQWIGLHMPELLFVPLFALIISHGISLLRYHFMAGEDEGRSADEIMFDPYPRIVILHVALIAGSFFVISAGGGSAAPVLIMVIIGKTWLDLHLHRRAHAKRLQARLERLGGTADEHGLTQID